MPHQSLRGLKQDAVPNQRHGEGKEHPLREGRHPPPSSPSSSSDSSRNLWGWPVSQILETDDVRPLIGCLQRRRHQPAALADGTESRTQDDGRMDGGSDGGGGAYEEKVGQRGGVVEECRKQGAVGVREKVSWWAGRQLFAGDRCMADKVYLTPTPGSTGHRGGGRPHSPPAQRVKFLSQEKEDSGKASVFADIVYK